MSAIAGYRSGFVHNLCFCPSAALSSEMALKISFVAGLAFGNEKIILFKSADLSPASDSCDNSSKALATLRKPGKRIASSCGVH